MIQNVQSIKNKIHILESLLHEHKFQAVFLSETWISATQLPYIHVEGYEFAAAYCRHQRRGGGVAILLPNGTKFTDRPDLSQLSIEYVVECCAIELKPNLLLINIYRANRQIEKFFDFLQLLLSKLKSHHYKKHIILGGDFNINATHNSNDYKRLTELMLEYNLHQIVSQPTRETLTSSSCIDLLFTNNKTFSLDVEDRGISDHKCLTYHFDTQPLHQPKPYFKNIRLFNNIKNIDSFKIKLSEINWNNILTTNNNINMNYNIFEDILKGILDSTIPIKRIKFGTSKTNNKWLTNGLKTSLKNKRHLKILVNQSNCKTTSVYIQRH